MVTTIAISLGLAFLSLLQHHRRSVQRHDRIIKAWCIALRLVENRRGAAVPPALGPKPKAKHRTPAARSSRRRARA